MEESEEIRLLLVKLVKSLVSHCCLKSLATNLDSVCQVLCISLADHFHEIKKEVGDVIVLIVAQGIKMPPQAAKNLLKSLIPNLSHSHTKLGSSIQYKENHASNYTSSLSIDADNFNEEYQKFLPTPFKGRPGKGCCKMVQDFIGQMIEPMRSSFQEWTETTRCSAARQLLASVIMGEQRANDYMHLLVPVLCSAVGDENLCIAKLLVESAHVLGWHSSPHNWLPLVLGHISNSTATAIQATNGLVIISGLLYGTQKHAGDKDLIKEVVRHLIEANHRFNQHGDIHNQTLAVLTNLVKVGGSSCKYFLSDILYVLLQVQGFGPDASLKQAVIKFEEVMTNAIGLSCEKDLYEMEADQLLKLVTADHESWSTNCYGQTLFQMLVHKLNVLAGPYMQGLLPVFKGCLHPDKNPGLRIKLLQLLDELFEIIELSPCWSSLAAVVLGQILLPCGVWSVGKVGAAVRHAAMVALGTFLRRGLCNQADLDSLLHSNQVLPIVLSCLEEDYYVDIRIVTCHVLENVLQISGKSLNEAQREEVKKALQNRLDDSSDNVRLRVLPAISSFFYTLPSSYSDASVRSFVSSILLHMDDDNNQIRECVYKALEVCTSLKPAIMEELIKNNCDRHQMREYCDYLLAKATCLQNNQEPSYA